MIAFLIIFLFVFASFGLLIVRAANRMQNTHRDVPLAPVALVAEEELAHVQLPKFGRKVSFVTQTGAKLRARVVGKRADFVALKRLGHPKGAVFYRQSSELA